MPEDTQNNQNTNNDNNGSGANGANTGADPKQKTEVSTAFDPKTIGEEDFNKIFDDPRLWTHPRFKELNDRAKKAKEYETQQAEAEEARLKEQKKFEELAEKNKQKAEEAENKYKQAILDNKIQLEASKAGVVDLEAVLKLVDRSKITLDDDGNVAGLEEAVKSLLEAKPYLKNGEANNNVTIGNGTNPGSNNTNVKRFTLSQIQDPEFYRENEKDILEAVRTNNIIDDQR